jgi:hypothetical protein
LHVRPCGIRVSPPWCLLEVFTVRFGSVRFGFYKKTDFFFIKKNRNRTEIGSNRPVSVRFGFLEKKPVQTGLARFFRFGSVFSGLARFFRFASVFRFDSVFFWFFFRFGFSGSGLKKPKPNRSVFSKF